MESSDLDFYTTQELIDALMRRKTFLGIVIHSEQDYKNRDWQGERMFKVHFNDNLDASQAGRLLDAIAENIEGQNY